MGGFIMDGDTERGADDPEVWALIPAYNAEAFIGAVVEEVRPLVDRVLVVDDGSSDATAGRAEAAGAQVLRHDHNQGKGAALATGFEQALREAAGLVITLDADGQHAPGDIPRFLEAYRRTGIPVWIGNRMTDRSTMPLVRRCTNRLMSALISRSIGQPVPDTQCGYRLFHRDVLPLLRGVSPHYEAESEVLFQLSAHGVRIGSVPVATIYGDEVSAIRPVRDTLRFLRMWRRCVRNRNRNPARNRNQPSG